MFTPTGFIFTPLYFFDEETINMLKYANRAKNLNTQVARNVHSVSAHIAEYQRVIMEQRNGADATQWSYCGGA